MFSSNASQVSNDVNYIEDVFSTYLYAGNGATQTITNGIDLAGKGGLVWIKSRSAVVNHTLWDTSRGVRNYLSSNNTDANTDFSGTSYGLSAFNANGFALGLSANGENSNGSSLCSWTFRKQPKFFDVVTYTGTGVQRDLPHSLGSAPGCMIVKRTSSTEDWAVYHRSLNGGVTPYNYFLRLGATLEQTSNTTRWVQDPTATHFTVGTHTEVNTAGQTYVAYLFAHDAGGFGLSGNENVVTCGSYTTDAAGKATVNLGYEPQFLIVKTSSTASDWYLMDSMRGLTVGTNSKTLSPNLADAEAQIGIAPTATGFVDTGAIAGNATMIYIAIRRGPMKVPTDGTKVYMPALDNETVQTGLPIDMFFTAKQSGSADNTVAMSRLTGPSLSLQTSSTRTENGSASIGNGFQSNNTFRGLVFSSPAISWAFSRAPRFFDEVCYQTASIASINHNLGVAPEFMIAKTRDVADGWFVWHKDLPTYRGYLHTSAAFTNDGADAWGTSPPTSTTFTASSYLTYFKYVWYGFASAPGVSKVGSYTGTGTTQAIACGFTAGARFVMIKRTDAAGDWYVWDSARGIVAGNDPYLRLNSTAAEVTSTDYIDPVSSGFEISSTAPAAINASGGSYIFLAVA